MGGFIDALSQVGKDVVENVGQKFEQSGAKKAFSQVIARDWEFQRSEAGKDLKDSLTDFLQARQQALQKGVDANKNLPKDMQKHPVELFMNANNIARANVAGRNDSTLTYLIHQASKAPNMDSAQQHMHAQLLGDYTSSILHDYETKPEFNKAMKMSQEEEISHNLENLKRIESEQSLLRKKGGYVGQSEPYSSFKKNVQKAKEFPTQIDTYPTYSPTTKLEHHFYEFAESKVAPFIFAPHLATALQPLVSTSPGSLIKTIVDMIQHGDGDTEFAKIMDFAHKAGIFGSNAYNLYAADYYGSRGLLAKYGGDRLGQIFYKSTHNPLFNTIRRLQLAFASTAGYHMAQDMAAQYFKDPTYKRAAYELSKMGINPAEIIAQKGILNDDQIQKAMWRFVDSKMFLDNSFARSQFSNSHWAIRMALLYHSYVSRMGRFLAEEMFYKPYKTFEMKPRYLAQIAQSVAVLGVPFPLAGLMTKNLTMLLRGDWSDIHMGQDFQNLMGKNGPRAAFREAVEDYVHIGAFGVLHSYIMGASRHAAANAMVGPGGNLASRGIEDTISPIYKELWEGKKAEFEHYKPILRDMIEYNPYAYDNIGKLFVHKFLPTKREEALRHPKPNFRFKSKIKRPHFHQ